MDPQPDEQPTRQFTSIADTARRLQVSELSVLRHIKRGAIPALRLGHRTLVPLSYFAEIEVAARAGVAVTTFQPDNDDR